MRLWLKLMGLAVVLTLSGCGGVTPVTGGTNGVLHSGAAMLSEIQITVHQVDGDKFKPIGFAVPQSDGTFQLVAPEAKGPLRLAPGDYRFTLESVGAPVVIPKEMSKPETTPLKATWTGSEPKLDIDVPSLKQS